MKTDTQLSISIIIPVHNVTCYLEQAVCSVASQSYHPKEIIVIDDGSDPESAEEIDLICKSFPEVTLFRQHHKGVAIARDHGLSQTSSNAVVFLDADDVMLPGSIEVLSRALASNPKAVASYGRTVLINEKNEITSNPIPANVGITSEPSLLEALMKRKIPFCNGSICIRTNALRRISGKNHNLTISEDWVLWCHLAASGEIIYAGDRVVMHRRKHLHNSSLLSLENNQLVHDACDRVFSDKLFLDLFGEFKIKELREECLCRIYSNFASSYAKIGDTELAQFYLHKITKPLSDFATS